MANLSKIPGLLSLMLGGLLFSRLTSL